MQNKRQQIYKVMHRYSKRRYNVKQIRYQKWKKGTLTLLCWETFQYRHESIYDMPYHNTGNTNSLIHRYLWQILHSVLLTIKSSALDYLPMNSA